MKHLQTKKKLKLSSKYYDDDDDDNKTKSSIIHQFGCLVVGQKGSTDDNAFHPLLHCQLRKQ